MTRIILRDGRVADLRKAQDTPQDRAMIQALFARSSAESLYFRFFHVVREVSEQVVASMIGDGGGQGMALLCVSGNRALAIGSYTRTSDDSAEVAFLVDDEIQQRGIGSLLLEHLANNAWLYGIRQFEANLLKDNYQMQSVFRASGFELRSEHESDMIHLVWTLGQNERSQALQETRERLATAASLHPFFHPQRVAVVGASRDPNRLGHLLLRHIMTSEFQGTVYPVNSAAYSVSAVRAYPSLSAIPEAIDLAVIVVPAAQVLSVVDDCIESGVRSVMIMSSGFSETDAEGLALEREVVGRLRNTGCRLIGPHSLGLINTNEEIQLNASFAPRMPNNGHVAIASHSGALGIAILEYANRIGIGISSFVSLGNRPDVSGNDLLQYWETDPDTNMILMYLESFGNPRKFSRITRRLSAKKPILAVKNARTNTSLAVSNAHAIAIAAEDAAVEAMFRQTGIVRVDTLQELFDVAAVLENESLVGGRRVAIVTNTAGGAVITVDTLLREGLEFVPPVINLGFEALADSYRVVLPQVLRDETVDAVIVLFTPVGVSDEEEVFTAVSAAICEVASDKAPDNPQRIHPYQKPVLANCLTTGDYLIRYIEVGPDRKIPIYPFPEQAVHALAKVVQYHEHRYRKKGHIPDLEQIDTHAVRSVIRQALQTPGETTDLPVDIYSQVIASLGIRAIDDGGVVTATIQLTTDKLFGPIMRLRLSNTTQMPHAGAAFAALRLTPLTDLDAAELVQEARLAAGIDAVPQEQALLDTLLRISQMVEDVPEVVELRADCCIVEETVALRLASVHMAAQLRQP